MEVDSRSHFLGWLSHGPWQSRGIRFWRSETQLPHPYPQAQALARSVTAGAADTYDQVHVPTETVAACASLKPEDILSTAHDPLKASVGIIGVNSRSKRSNTPRSHSLNRVRIR